MRDYLLYWYQGRRRPAYKDPRLHWTVRDTWDFARPGINGQFYRHVPAPKQRWEFWDGEKWCVSLAFDSFSTGRDDVMKPGNVVMRYEDTWAEATED